MDGINAEKYINCKQKINNEQTYSCDLCISVLHKNCVNLSSSEIRCMPLQKRVLVLLCVNCKEFLARTPDMVNIIDQMKMEINDLKEEIIALRNEVKESSKIGNKVSSTYAEVVENNSKKKYNENIQQPTLIIKPNRPQNSDHTKKCIQRAINPSELQIGISNFKGTKNGSVVVKCTTKQEMEKLKNAMDTNLLEDYQVKLPKKIRPRVKITGIRQYYDKKELEETIKQQNSWIQKNDLFEVTYIKQNKEKTRSTAFLECSPTTFWKFISADMINVGWTRCHIYEEIAMTRCYNCQGYYHKSVNCKNKVVCGNCSGNHDTSVCSNESKKCINCEYANKNYKTNYNITHNTADPECSSLKYKIEAMKHKIDYGE